MSLTRALPKQTAMADRFEFVEPLLQLGLDIYAKNDGGHPAYATHAAWGTSDTAVHKLLLSQGIYDEVVDGADGIPYWAAWCMMRNADVFDFFVKNFFPRFYQMCLCHRMRILLAHYSCTSVPMAIGRIFHPDGHFCRGDLWFWLPSLKKTVFDILMDAYLSLRSQVLVIRMESQFPGCPCKRECPSSFGEHDLHEQVPEHSPSLANVARQWCEIRLIMRQAVTALDKSELSFPRLKSGRTPFLEMMAAFRWQIRDFDDENSPPLTNVSRYRRWKYEIQEVVRDWLEDVRAGGKDLERYGMIEQALFFCHTASRQGRWSRETRRAGHRWTGFTTGRRPEDWKLLWEWDADVEEIAREFWASIEEPVLTVPGSWVDDDDACCTDDHAQYAPAFGAMRIGHCRR